MVSLDNIPVLRIKRRLGRFFKRFKFWIFLFVFLLVVSVLSTPLKIAWDIVKGIGSVMKPIIDNPAGRVVLVTVFLAIVAWVVWWRFAARLRRLIGFHALDRFLDGLNHMVMERYPAAIRCFETVVKRGRLVDLEAAVPGYPDILDAARIKLAECQRIEGDLDQALRWIESVREKALPDDLRRILGEVRALVYDAHPGIRDEIRQEEVKTSTKADAKNVRLLRVLEARAEKKDDLAEAVKVQHKILKATPRPGKAAARRDLAVLRYRRGRAAEAEGDLAEAVKEYRTAARVEGFDLPNLRLGDLALADDDIPAALDAWSKAPPVPALDRIRTLLADGRLQGTADRALILQMFPYGETLLVFAEHFLESGERRRARSTLAKLERLGLSGPAVDRLAARIARDEGNPEEASRREVAALRNFLTDGRL
jgi:tetratricopeptide (TPR) repeat protein